MQLNKYVKNEVERGKPLDESMFIYGKTDSYKGDKYCGPHHHDYVLWSPQIGWGKTGDALDDPEVGSGKLVAATHEHMIIGGKVLEAAGHTHKLLKGDERLDTDPPKKAIETKEAT